jgi:hypothetical protein
MRARVGPSEGSAWMVSTSWRREARSSREIALRAAGRLRERILMLPQLGAGIDLAMMTGDDEGVEYSLLLLLYKQCVGSLLSRNREGGIV